MTENTLTRDQIKDFRKRPGFYFHSQKEERLKYAEEVIESVWNQDSWADIAEDDTPTSTGGGVIPFYGLETIVPHQFYKGNIKMFKGHIGHKQLGLVGIYPNLMFFDFDTEELRHPTEVSKWRGMLSKNLGEAIQQIENLYNVLDPYLDEHAFRVYMTQRGTRCVEVGSFYEWNQYPQLVSTLPGVAEGEIKLDIFHMNLCMKPNQVGIATKEELINLKMPPSASIFLDRPSEHLWISAMPILELGTPEEVTGSFVEENHDKICMEGMTPERIEFFWSELRRRLPSVEDETRERIVDFVTKNYEEVNL